MSRFATLSAEEVEQIKSSTNTKKQACPVQCSRGITESNKAQPRTWVDIQDELCVEIWNTDENCTKILTLHAWDLQLNAKRRRSVEKTLILFYTSYTIFFAPTDQVSGESLHKINQALPLDPITLA